MHLSMSSQQGEAEVGHRVGIWHFPINWCKIPYPPKCEKNVRSEINEIPQPGNDLWSQARKNSNKLPHCSKIIPMPYPEAKAIDQIPALCPASSPPPAGLTLIGALHVQSLKLRFLKILHNTPFYVNRQLFWSILCSEAVGKSEFFRVENGTLNFTLWVEYSTVE